MFVLLFLLPARHGEAVWRVPYNQEQQRRGQKRVCYEGLKINRYGYMYINVSAKLWLAFFSTMTLCVLAMYLLLHNSLKRGFLDYTSQQAVQRLEILHSALSNIHREEDSFLQLINDPQRWLDLKALIFSESTAAGRGVDPPDSNRATATTRSYYTEFVSSITLHDANKRLLMGVIKPGQNVSWLPIVVNNSTVAFIGYVKPDVVIKEADRRFMQHQLKIFSIISLMILIISIGVAALLARKISRPIKMLSNGAEALAAGNYKKRIAIASKDEIGQLCQNFNQLAHTLEANEQSRAVWIADISHELRTPISVLKAQIEAMQDGVRALNQTSLSHLHKKVSELNSLIDDLFELTLSNIGALSYHKEDTSLYHLVSTCVDLHQVKARDAGLELIEILPADSPVFVWGDRKRLRQLLSNLLENAIRYTSRGGRIEVHLRETANTATLLISDSAPAVPDNQHEAIFERLFRLENSRSRDTGGAGLGLAICRNIVAAHQGEISAHHSPLGGLTIQVQIPRNINR